MHRSIPSRKQQRRPALSILLISGSPGSDFTLLTAQLDALFNDAGLHIIISILWHLDVISLNLPLDVVGPLRDFVLRQVEPV